MAALTFDPPLAADVEYIGSGQSVENAARRMRDRQLRFLPVCKPDGRVVGILTERDIVIRAVAAGRAPELCSVDEIMTKGIGPGVRVDERGRLIATVGQRVPGPAPRSEAQPVPTGGSSNASVVA